jgi:hypothetical protein
MNIRRISQVWQGNIHELMPQRTALRFAKTLEEEVVKARFQGLLDDDYSMVGGIEVSPCSGNGYSPKFKPNVEIAINSGLAVDIIPQFFAFERIRGISRWLCQTYGYQVNFSPVYAECPEESYPGKYEVKFASNDPGSTEPNPRLMHKEYYLNVFFNRFLTPSGLASLPKTFKPMYDVNDPSGIQISSVHGVPIWSSPPKVCVLVDMDSSELPHLDAFIESMESIDEPYLTATSGFDPSRQSNPLDLRKDPVRAYLYRVVSTFDNQDIVAKLQIR